jgi:hypothetical protein
MSWKLKSQPSSKMTYCWAKSSDSPPPSGCLHTNFHPLQELPLARTRPAATPLLYLRRTLRLLPPLVVTLAQARALSSLHYTGGSPDLVLQEAVLSTSELQPLPCLDPPDPLASWPMNLRAIISPDNHIFGRPYAEAPQLLGSRASTTTCLTGLPQNQPRRSHLPRSTPTSPTRPPHRPHQPGPMAPVSRTQGPRDASKTAAGAFST